MFYIMLIKRFNSEISRKKKKERVLVYISILYLNTCILQWGPDECALCPHMCAPCYAKLQTQTKWVLCKDTTCS